MTAAILLSLASVILSVLAYALSLWKFFGRSDVSKMLVTAWVFLAIGAGTSMVLAYTSVAVAVLQATP
jgi:hypothetical protein